MTAILGHTSTFIFIDGYNITRGTISRGNTKSNNTAQFYPHGSLDAVATVQGSNSHRVTLTLTESDYESMIASLGEDLGNPRLFSMTVTLVDEQCQRQTVKTWFDCSITDTRDQSDAPGISSDAPAPSVNTTEISIMAQRFSRTTVPLPLP